MIGVGMKLVKIGKVKIAKMIGLVTPISINHKEMYLWLNVQSLVAYVLLEKLLLHQDQLMHA